jgi:hypothetical protein
MNRIVRVRKLKPMNNKNTIEKEPLPISNYHQTHLFRKHERVIVVRPL